MFLQFTQFYCALLHIRHISWYKNNTLISFKGRLEKGSKWRLKKSSKWLKSGRLDKARARRFEGSTRLGLENIRIDRVLVCSEFAVALLFRCDNDGRPPFPVHPEWLSCRRVLFLRPFSRRRKGRPAKITFLLLSALSRPSFEAFCSNTLALPLRATSSRDGRVVKALDSKSNGIFPHRFESCSRR